MKNIKEKQKLGKRDTYTPTGVPQARGNCGHALNREGSPGVQGLKTSSNNPGVGLPRPAGGLKADLLVFILNKDGKPLIPCKPAKAKHPLKEKKTKVIQRTPLFTVSQRRRNNRCLQLNGKGFKPSIRRKRYGFQPGDTVLFQKREWNVLGTHSYGKSVIIKKGEKRMDANVRRVKLRRYGKGLKFNIQFLPPPKGWGALEATR